MSDLYSVWSKKLDYYVICQTRIITMNNTAGGKVPSTPRLSEYATNALEKIRKELRMFSIGDVQVCWNCFQGIFLIFFHASKQNIKNKGTCNSTFCRYESLQVEVWTKVFNLSVFCGFPQVLIWSFDRKKSIKIVRA